MIGVFWEFEVSTAALIRGFAASFTPVMFVDTLLVYRATLSNRGCSHIEAASFICGLLLSNGHPS
ncbi:hypothetical protein D3C83_308890 [compost metagenome]